MHITLRTMRVRTGQKHQLGQCVEKVVYSGDICHFLYLTTRNIPRMFHNVKHLQKNVTQERRYPQRDTGPRTPRLPFCIAHGAARFKMSVDVKSSEPRRCLLLWSSTLELLSQLRLPRGLPGPGDSKQSVCIGGNCQQVKVCVVLR